MVTFILYFDVPRPGTNKVSSRDVTVHLTQQFPKGFTTISLGIRGYISTMTTLVY